MRDARDVVPYDRIISKNMLVVIYNLADEHSSPLRIVKERLGKYAESCSAPSQSTNIDSSPKVRAICY